MNQQQNDRKAEGVELHKTSGRGKQAELFHKPIHSGSCPFVCKKKKKLIFKLYFVRLCLNACFYVFVYFFCRN